MDNMTAVTPFSSGTEYMEWEDRNCVRCAKSCYATRDMATFEYDDFDCAIQEALIDGQIFGTVTADIAKRANLPGGATCGEFEPVEES